MKAVILNDHFKITDKFTVIGEITLFFDGIELVNDRDKIIDKIKKNPSDIRYILSDVDAILEYDDDLELYSSAQSAGLFYRINNNEVSIAKDERDLYCSTDNIIEPDFKHQIMFRKFDESSICVNIKRNSPLLITRIKLSGEVETRLNLNIDNTKLKFQDYYENLWMLCSFLSSNYNCAVLFSGGIDSAMLAQGVTKDTELVHYAYKDYSIIERELSVRVAAALNRDVTMFFAEDKFDAKRFDAYSKKILPCVIEYKVKFNWADYSLKPYLLTGQNADSFIYGDSFNRSNLRGNPGRLIINIMSLHKRLKYFIFSFIFINKENALKLYYNGSMNEEFEHSTFNLQDLLKVYSKSEVPENRLTQVVRSIYPNRLTILQWIKIYKILRILHNVNYNGRAVREYNGITRINPYSSAFMIEDALKLKYSILTIFVPKYQSFSIFKKKTKVSFFRLLSSCETWYSSLQRRSNKDSILADEKISSLAIKNGAKVGNKRALMEKNFKNWIHR